MEEEINILDYLKVIWKWKTLIIIIIVLFGLFSWWKAIGEPKMYKTDATLLPPSGGSSGLGALVSSLPIPIDVSGIGGGSKGVNYKDIFQSRIVAERVVDQLKLAKYFPDIEDKMDLVSTIQASIKVNEGSVIKVEVEAKTADLAVWIAEGYLKALEWYNQTNNIQTAHRTRVFIEGQMADAESRLRGAEGRLRFYGEQKDTYFDSDIARTIALERYKREIEAYAQLYTMLMGEREKAKIDETKEGQFFQVLDMPIAPKSPYKPNVKLQTMIGLAVGLFVGIFLAFFIEYILANMQPAKPNSKISIR